MPSLPWILALTLTFLHCLSASPTKDPLKIIHTRAEETLLQIKTLNKTNCLTANSTFYINSDVDHIEQMLHCVKAELVVVEKECFDDVEAFEEYIQACRRTIQTIETILNYTGGQTQNKPMDLPCEGSHKPYKEFLKDLKTLIQKLNTKF